MPKTQNSQKTASEHKRRTEAYAQRVKNEYAAAVNSILALKKTVPELPTGQMYSFDGDTKKVQYEVERVLRRLHAATLATIKTGVEAEWEQANKEVDSLLTSAMGKKILKQPQLAGWFDRNEKAMDAFLARSEQGMNLSDRIWRNTRQFRDEMEVAMTVAIGEGQSAGAMSRKVRQYLNDPDLMFRRFRYKDENGNWQLKWKKRIKTDDGRYKFIDYDRKSYKVGAGNYKSSYRNAMRLTRTETNMAYRRADHDRWQTLDFVLGQRITTSKTHDDLVKNAKEKDKAKDICDQLAGDYPKEFVFDGWHPQCMCICTAIMRSEEEMNAKLAATLRGEPYEYKEKAITNYPAGFQQFIKDNRKSIADAQKAGTEPYFIKYNAGAVNDILGKEVVEDAAAEDKSIVLSTIEKAKIRQAQRTPEQIEDIKKRWGQSREVNKMIVKAEEKMPGVRQLYAQQMQKGTDGALSVAYDMQSAATDYERETRPMAALGYEKQRELLKERIANSGSGTVPQIKVAAMKRTLADIERHIANREHRDPLELRAARQALRTNKQIEDIKKRWETREIDILEKETQSFIGDKMTTREIDILEKETQSFIGDKMTTRVNLTQCIEELNREEPLIKYVTAHKDYPMLNRVERDVNEYTTKSGIKIMEVITSPSEVFSRRQRFTPKQVATVLEQMPIELRSVIRKIQLCDFRNPDDNYWSQKYNTPNFRSFATGGGGVVSFYENNDLPTNYTDDTALRENLSHECGHNIDNAVGNISESTLWKRARNYDRYNGAQQEAVTEYGGIHANEDFAESVKLFVSDPNKFKEDFPARYAILSQIIK